MFELLRALSVKYGMRSDEIVPCFYKKNIKARSPVLETKRGRLANGNLYLRCGICDPIFEAELIDESRTKN